MCVCMNMCVCLYVHEWYICCSGGNVDGASKTLIGVQVDQSQPSHTMFLIAVSHIVAFSNITSYKPCINCASCGLIHIYSLSRSS